MNWERHLSNEDWMAWGEYLATLPKSDVVTMFQAALTIDGLRRVLEYVVPPRKPSFCGTCGTEFDR